MGQDDFTTVAKEIPYVGWVVKAWSLLEKLGTVEEPEAIRLLREALRRMQTDIDALKEAVARLNERVAMVENTARRRWLTKHYDKLTEELLKLSRRPDDINAIAEVAHAVGNTAQELASDEDLWLWSDIDERNDPPTLTDLEFKLIPLPVFAFAIGLFAQAASMHIKRDTAVRRTYQERIDKLLWALSIRESPPNADPLSTFRALIDKYGNKGIPRPHSLPEKILFLVRVYIEGAHRYVDHNRECRFNVFAVDHIERTRSHLRTFTVTWPSGTRWNTVCTAQPGWAFGDEQEFFESYQPWRLVRELKGMLERLKHAGTLSKSVDGYFGPEWPKPVRLDLYAVDGDNDLQQYWATTMSDLSRPVDWQRAPDRVGKGWGSMRAVVAGTWNGLYAVRSNGAITWYRHDGQREQLFRWDGPHLVEPAPLGIHRVEHYMGSDDGSLYQAVFIPGGPGPNPERMTKPTRELWYRQRLADTDPPKLGKPVSLRLQGRIEEHGEPEWRKYSTMFAAGRGTFYGIDTAGRLYWHRHQVTTRSVEGPILLGDGWNGYTHVFAGRDGLIFSITADGGMLAHAITQWDMLKDGVRRPKQLSEPVPVLGPAQWSSYKRFVSLLALPPVHVA